MSRMPSPLPARVREDLLRPRFLVARRNGAILHVNLDGAAGFPTSFLEEACGGVAPEFGSAKVVASLEIVCNDEPYLLDDILEIHPGGGREAVKAFWRYVSAIVLAFGIVIILGPVGGLGWIFPPLLSAHVGANLDLVSFISACAKLLIVWIINYVYIATTSSHKADSDLLLEVVQEVIASLGTLHWVLFASVSGQKSCTIPTPGRSPAARRKP